MPGSDDLQRIGSWVFVLLGVVFGVLAGAVVLGALFLLMRGG